MKVIEQIRHCFHKAKNSTDLMMNRDKIVNDAQCESTNEACLQYVSVVGTTRSRKRH